MAIIKTTTTITRRRATLTITTAINKKKHKDTLPKDILHSSSSTLSLKPIETILIEENALETLREFTKMLKLYSNQIEN